MLLLNAGHEASVNGAGNGWWTLFRHPDAAGAAPGGARRSLPTAIEELLRFDTPLRAVRALGARGRSRSRGVTLPRGAGGRAPVRVGQPRPGGLRRTPTSSTSAATRTRTCRSGPGSTTASARRWPSSSSGSRSRRSCAGRRGSSSSRRPAGSRRSSCAGSSALPRPGLTGRTAALRRARRLVHDRDVGRGRGPLAGPARRAPSGRPRRRSSSSPTSASTATRRPTSSGRELPALDRLAPGVRDRPDRRQRRRPAASRRRATRRTSRRSSTRCSARLPADRIVTVADAGLHGHAGRRRLRRPAPAARRRSSPSTRSMARLAADRGIAYVDIFDLSLRAADRPVAGRRRRAPPERRPVRAVGRADRAGRRGASSGADPGRRRGLRLVLAALELVEPLVRDPEVVGDLVVDGVGDGRRERVPASGWRARAGLGRW